MAQTYRDLIIWQKAMAIVRLAYNLTAKLPAEENFGLKTQMRRSAVSIASNIAEGYRRGSSGEFRQFLLIAFGSGAELETQLEICRVIYNLSNQDLDSALEEEMKLLNVSTAKLEK